MKSHALTAIGAVLVTATLATADVEIIFTEIPGDPSAVIPGSGGLEFDGILSLHHSYDGQHWIFKGFARGLDSDSNDVIVVGSGPTGSMVARESLPSPIAGRTFGFMDSDCGVNDAGHYAFGNRLDDGPTSDDEIVFMFDGESLAAAVREGDPAPGLFDPGGSGDETFGNSLNSVHLLNDDTTCFHADQIQGIPTAYRSAVYQGSAPVAQEGLTLKSVIGVDVYSGFTALSGNTFTSSADGSSWIVESDLDPDIIDLDEAAIVNGNPVVRDGDTFPDQPQAVDAIFAVHMTGAGTWFVRGDFPDDTDWAVRNGDLYVATGDPITAGSTESFTDAIGTITGDDDGNVIVVGTTDNADPDLATVMVLNLETVLAREGDPIDLDDDGVFDDDVFIRSFGPQDVFIGADSAVYACITLRNAADTLLGDALIRIPLGDVPGDLDGDGDVDVDDLLLVLGGWGPCGDPCDGDADGDGDVDVDDLLLVLGNWS